MKALILIVEDTETNIDLLVEALGGDYDINVAMDGQAALESIDEVLPDIVLLDIMMPKMDGYEVCRRLKKDVRTRHIPVIFLTALTDGQEESKGLALGAVDYITKPFNPFLVKARIKNHLLLKQYQDLLEDLVRQRTYQLEKTQDVTIKSMGTLAEYRDPETGGHIKRTQNYVRLLTEKLKDHPAFRPHLTEPVIRALYQSAPLHDIGKVGVPDHILMKPGRLTPREFEQMKRHARLGRDAIAASEKELGDTDTFLSYARQMAYAHHEKWDGTGYPRGLKGEKIPLPGRLMAVADVYDALISSRVYKPAFSHSYAVEVIRKGKGTHFDPAIVAAFLEIEQQFKETAIEYADSQEDKLNLVHDNVSKEKEV